MLTSFPAVQLFILFSAHNCCLKVLPGQTFNHFYNCAATWQHKPNYITDCTVLCDEFNWHAKWAITETDDRMLASTLLLHKGTRVIVKKLSKCFFKHCFPTEDTKYIRFISTKQKVLTAYHNNYGRTDFSDRVLKKINKKKKIIREMHWWFPTSFS